MSLHAPEHRKYRYILFWIDMGQAQSTPNPNIEKRRRRLSVAGTDAKLDGMTTDDETEQQDIVTTGKGHRFIGIYEGKSQKGYLAAL